MTGSIVLVHLAGAVSLMLWATRMVRTGVERAYGDILRSRLRDTLRNPLLSVAAGAVLAIAFQSSTAVALLIGSFVGSGFVSGAAGLVAVLGADLGSALVVKLLTFNLSFLIPVAFFCGTTIFLATERPTWRQFGRIVMGAGLLILSLQMIGEAAAPLRESQTLPVVVGHLSGDPVTAFMIGALITWMFHSSAAFILLVAALAMRGVIPPELGVVLVLGANIGGGAIGAMLSRTMPAASRVVPFGNLVVRSIGAVTALILLVWVNPPLDRLGDTAASQIVHAHILFNAVLVIVGLPFTGLIMAALDRTLPGAGVARPPAIGDAEANLLDREALSSPSRALANVTRAVVGLCETVEVMLTNVMDVYEAPDRARIDALSAMDDRVDSRHEAIKSYLSKISTKGMSDAEARRTRELLDACVKLEQVGDIIVCNMLVHVRKKLDRNLTFTPEGWRELSNLHASVLANARLAFNVLISRDREIALLLVREKDRLRDLERTTSERHFDRLRQGSVHSLETSSLHLDTVRDLKQINSLLASMAYPVLEDGGLLRDSRLRAVEA